jgi:hypothetical protein
MNPDSVTAIRIRINLAIAWRNRLTAVAEPISICVHLRPSAVRE